MKQLLFIFYLLVSTIFQIKAQTYTPMNLDTTSFWVNSCQVYFNGPKCENSITSFIEKDTVINSIQYFKLVSYFNSSTITQDCLLYLGYINTPHFIREDTVARKVWMYDGVNPEISLVDFNLNQNDTLHLCSTAFAIDSVVMDTIANMPRRLQYYHTLLGGGNTFTIEGIGNTENFPYCGYGEWQTPFYSLQYYCKNGQQLYPDNTIGSCIRPTPLSAAQIDNQPFDFKYSSNVLNLKHVTEQTKLQVLTYTGQEVLNQFIKDVNYQIDFSQLVSSGIYIVLLQDTRRYQAIKILVQ